MISPDFENNPPLILVVDDEKTLRLVLRRAMEKEGYRVAEATNGEECLESCQQLQPDLVLLDAMMPKIDGFTCCAQLPTQLGDECPAVLMITTLNDKASVDRAFQVGANDYVTKPIDWPVLNQRVRRLIETRWAMIQLRQQNRVQNNLALQISKRAIAEMVAANASLRTEINERMQAELALSRARDELEIRVIERTAELTKINTSLQAEIISRQRAELALQQANEQLAGWVRELEQRNREVALLSELSDVLQACLEVEEAYSAIANLMPRLFNGTKGSIFLLNTSRNLVEEVATWGTSTQLPSQELFIPNECWALRRGRVHFHSNAHGGLQCKHLDSDSSPAESLCVPMTAQGEALGVLCLSSLESGQLTATKQQLAVTVTENISLALANLKLRQTLQSQSIRDPLTGLFNRRYMEESLEREIHRCKRKQQPLGIIMLDVDHFKRFNDTFGHDAGDAVLRELGMFLQKNIRKSDIACRYGGEELILILPEASLEIIKQRAEQIRVGVKHLNVQHQNRLLGTIALSLGVACFPEHGLTGEAVIRAADAALYCAKNQGRDAVRLAV